MSHSRMKAILQSGSEGALAGLAGGLIKDSSYYLAEKPSNTFVDTVILLAIGKCISKLLLSNNMVNQLSEKLSFLIAIAVLNKQKNTQDALTIALTKDNPVQNLDSICDDLKISRKKRKKINAAISTINFLQSLAEYVVAGTIGYYLFKLMHAKLFPNSPCLSYSQMLFNTVTGSSAVKLCSYLIDDFTKVKASRA